MQNEVEKEGMREAHLRDAVALCDHFSWFEERMEAGEKITEVRPFNFPQHFNFPEYEPSQRMRGTRRR